MKTLLFAILAVTLSDLAVNHGDGIGMTMSAARGFIFWLAHVGEGSIFTQ